MQKLLRKSKIDIKRLYVMPVMEDQAELQFIINTL